MYMTIYVKKLDNSFVYTYTENRSINLFLFSKSQAFYQLILYIYTNKYNCTI